MSRIRQMLRQDEGEVLYIYLDTENYATVGIGHLIYKGNNKSVAAKIIGATLKDGKYWISQERSNQLFTEDIGKHEQAIKRSPIGDLYANLSIPRQDAVLNMVFNLGLNGFLGFKQAIAALKAGDWNKAADCMLDSKWARQVKSRSKRVTDVIRYNDYRGYGW